MKIASFAALALALTPFAALAQSLPQGEAVPPLTLMLVPATPAPYGALTITPESTVVDLAAATITISVNGAKVASGNAAPVTITLGAPGTKTTIVASASLGGQTYTARTTLFPGALSLVEEPLSSAPPLYPGKPLAADGGSVRLVAVPDFESAPGVVVAPGKLVYTWSQDGSTLDSASGIGRQAIIVAAPLPYRGSTISVSVQSQDGAISGAASLALASEAPIVRIYANDPLQGILFDHALGGTMSVGSELTLFAAPYSFAIDNGLPQVNWFLSGAKAQSGDLITLRPTGSGKGSAALTASVASAGAQNSAAASLTLTFGNSGGSSLFGL